MKQRPDDAKTIHVPCVIFDGKSEDFATEMFVIINSTPTRINKSHLIDLYEKVSWAEPDKKFAARVLSIICIAKEGDSPLRYKINRLGGTQQAGEMDPAGRAVSLQRDPQVGCVRNGASSARSKTCRARRRSITRSCVTSCAPPRRPGGDAWGHAGYMVTRPVTTQGDVARSRADLAHEDAEPKDDRVKRWARRLGPWTDLARSFKSEGFYERFPAKGQVERVGRIYKELGRAANIARRGKDLDGDD